MFNKGKFDAFVNKQMGTIVGQSLDRNKKERPTEQDAIALLNQGLKAVKEAQVSPYFDYQYYQAYDDNNFEYMVGNVLPTDVEFLVAIQQAATAAPTNAPNYPAFQQTYRNWAEKIINQLHRIEGTDTLFHIDDIRAGLSKIGDNALTTEVTEAIYQLTETIEKGTLLKTFIAQTATQLNRLAAQPSTLAYKNYPASEKGQLEDYLVLLPTQARVTADSGKASKSSIELVKATISYGGGSYGTPVKFLFMAVTDVEKFFNSIDLKDINYKGQDLSGLLKMINVGVKVKSAGAMIGAEDLIYKSSNVDYFEVELLVKSMLSKNENKLIDLQTAISCKNNTYKISFEDGATYISGRTYLKPKYEYQ